LTEASAKELLDKMASSRFPWRTLLFLVIATIAGVISYDVITSGTFKKSKTAKLLKDAGLLVFLEQAWNRIRVYTGKAIVWLQENVPHYYGKACAFAGPYLQLFWEKLQASGVYIAEVTKPHRDWLNVKIPQLMEWVNKQVPWLWAAIQYYAAIVWDYTVYCSLWVWHHVVHYTHITGTWLQENVFTGNLSGENIQKTLSSSMATVQSYSSSAMEWCMKTWTGKK
jgi:hypothetical protein